MRLDGPGWPDFELADFAGALGEAGRAEVGRIVEARAASAEPDVLGRTPFGIRILREQLAELSGDVDRYVAVLGEHLYAARSTLRSLPRCALPGAAATPRDGRGAAFPDWAT
jgi:hypothetical protein